MRGEEQSTARKNLAACIFFALVKTVNIQYAFFVGLIHLRFLEKKRTNTSPRFSHSCWCSCCSQNPASGRLPFPCSAKKGEERGEGEEREARAKRAKRDEEEGREEKKEEKERRHTRLLVPKTQRCKFCLW